MAAVGVWGKLNLGRLAEGRRTCADGGDPLVFVDQYVPSLRSMRAIALDIGNQDPFVATNRQLADALTRLDVAHTFDVYDGDHGIRIRERFEMHVLPFFSRQLTAP